MIFKSVAFISCAAIVLTLAFPAAAAEAQTPTAATAPSAIMSSDDMADRVLAIMKKKRMFRLISEHVPEFDTLMRNRIKTVVSTMPQYAWEEQAFLQSQALVQYYFAVYAPMASDDSIYRLLKYDTENLALYADKPEACIGYALGTPAFAKIAPADYIEKVSDLKADMFESAFAAHSTAISSPTSVTSGPCLWRSTRRKDSIRRTSRC